MKPVAILLLILVFGMCRQSNSRPELIRDLDSLFLSEYKPGEPGGSILLKKGDQTVYLKNIGLADIGTGEKITENTLFNLGSISKTFISNGILILQEQGALSLNDSIYKYFNDFRDTAIARKVKIIHLLSHTSGLPDNRGVASNTEFYLTAKDAENFEPLKSTTQLNFEPGQNYEYSNPAFNGLALIIEQTTGKPWQKFIEEKIFIPSGMKTSKITDGDYPSAGVSHAYQHTDSGYVEDDYGEFPTFAASGNGGVWSSVIELAKYETAIRNHVFLSEAITSQSRTIYHPQNWAGPTGPFIGYSWFINKQYLFEKENSFPVDFVYHLGSQGGFETFYISVPEKNILFIGLFNKPTKDFYKLVKDAVELISRHNWLD